MPIASSWPIYVRLHTGRNAEVCLFCKRSQLGTFFSLPCSKDNDRRAVVAVAYIDVINCRLTETHPTPMKHDRTVSQSVNQSKSNQYLYTHLLRNCQAAVLNSTEHTKKYNKSEYVYMTPCRLQIGGAYWSILMMMMMVVAVVWLALFYTVSHKKCATKHLSISLPNIDQFQKFFYWHTLWTICNNGGC